MGTASRACFYCLLTVLSLGGAACAQNTSQTIRHHKVEVPGPFPPELTAAENAIQKNDYATAEPLLNQVVTADPANFQAWFDLGFVENKLNKPQESIAAYRKSVAAKPDVFESNLNLGVMLARTGQPDAEQFLRAATVLKPAANVEEGQARAWTALADLVAKDHPEQAIDAYRRAASLQPKDASLHSAQGFLLEKENRFADAEEQYRQALAIDPASSEALTGLANIYTRGQRFADAAGVLRKLAAAHPAEAGPHLQLGRVLAAMQQTQEAASEFEAALKLAPDNTAAQRELAELHIAGGEFAQAEQQYRALLAASPNDAELHHGLGVTLLKQRKFADAQQEFLAAVKLKPDFGAAYGDLAVAAVENKNYALAIKAADARARFLPEIPVSYFLRATAYDHLRDYKQASQNYHKFLDVANGQYPDQEWQARHRLIAIEPKK